MYFPKYWAKGKVEAPNGENETMGIEAWGWSDLSPEDARQRATARAQAALSRIPGPRDKRSTYYEDGNRPLRETILQDLSRGPVRAVISRNSFGCDVLNTDCVAFADLDYDAPAVPFLERLFDSGGRKAAARRMAWETQNLNNLKAWQDSNAAWSFRVYRTAGGLRLLVTSKLIQAGTPESNQWLETLGSDPLYRKLCRTQKSFRARLTPKPWRCGCDRVPVRHPCQTAQEQKAMDQWLAGYQAQTARFAVCEFVEAMGFTSSLPELQSLIDLHDERTAAMSGRPLA